MIPEAKGQRQMMLGLMQATLSESPQSATGGGEAYTRSD